MASSSNSPPTSPWDVFLSFRGTDTRFTFTDHLYNALHRAGIRTFKDNPELRSGEVISDSLIQAIQDSKAYVVVLSENYASSSWCLDELVEILRCYKRLKRLVVPVFYYIDPYVVRHQIESFKEAFDKHQTRYDVEKVNNWRLTLKELSDFSGYHVSKNRSQSDIIDEVVDRISLEVNPKTLYVAKYQVGLDSRVKDITALLNSNTEGVIRIGIHGMGGVGKTTLAKALYNQNYQRFQGSCFLANVREVSGTENGLVGLQHQLIVDVLKCNNLNIGNKDQGIKLIRARLCSKKVLLVVDDLDNLKPLEYLEGSFASGSLIVITTRNEDLLDRIKVNAKYKVNQMDRYESRQLFTQHAFRDDNISHIFTELSNEILEKAAGLPLALQVFGSTLLDESEDGWRWFIDKLKRAPNDDVEENLMISFDALKSIDPNLQDIFLDIACFYIGWKKEEVAKILETCYTFVNRKVDILQKRCLITINKFGILGMHDLLREMGRKIARNNSPDEPGKHSRLWVLEDIDTVLKNHKGTKAIQGIISSYYDYYYYEDRINSKTFVAESFKRMSKLKFLYLNNVNLTGSFEQTFEDLRWLRWAFCPLECLPSEFYAEKLVTLELPHSNLRTLWKAPQEFKRLKTLNMSGSEELKTTPDFNRLPCLETLDLSNCSSLEEVHVSIGILARSLVHLDLENCIKLRSLPDSICSLRALEVLIVDGCTRLEALPTELGSIESLKLSVSKLPYSIGRLSNLVNLYFGGNKNLESLPDSICNLRSLEILDISDCQKLEELPDLLGMITSLRMLVVDCMSLNRLPDLSSLKHLMKLDLRNCFALKEIQGLEEVTSLKDLTLWSCTSLKRLPNLSNFKQLERLSLTNCSGLTKIQGLEELSSLKFLHMARCNSHFLACTLTKRFFQILSRFGHKVEFLIGQREFRYWISTLPSEFGFDVSYCLDLGIQLELGSRMSLDLQPNASHNFLAIILAFEDRVGHYEFKYSVKNITTGFIWSGTLGYFTDNECSIVIVPSSILSIGDGDNRIELKSNQKIVCGIHLLYKTNNVEDERSNPLHSDLESNKMWLSVGSSSTTVNVREQRSNLVHSDLGSSTTVNVREQRSNPVHSDLGSNRKGYTLGSSSTTVNVGEKRSNPLDNDLESNKNWLSLGNSSTTVKVEENRSCPSKRLKHLECDNNWLSL